MESTGNMTWKFQQVSQRFQCYDFVKGDDIIKATEEDMTTVMEYIWSRAVTGRVGGRDAWQGLFDHGPAPQA
jgi:hypothetical protein